MIEFKLPSLGAEMDQGKLLEWKIKPGDRVERGQVIAVVDTSKAAVDVEIWQAGRVAELLTQPGETIAVGTVMARLLEGTESAAGLHAAAPATPAAPVAPAAPASVTPTSVTAPPTAPPTAPSVRTGTAGAIPTPAALRKPASPAARKRARELGVDIESITGTGPHGSVSIQDVELAAAGGKPLAAVAAAPVPAVMPAAARATPAAGSPPAPAAAQDRNALMRQAIAAAMSRSKREIPHYYLAESICMRKAVDWLTAFNTGRPVTERVLMGALQLKAVALTLKRFPELNGYWTDGRHQASTSIHTGVAISLRQGGLIAPAIHDTDRLALPELMAALTDLVTRARAGSLRSSELSDATVTVTNLGEQGVESVQGVIYPPQVALIGFGRVAIRPWAQNNALSAEPTVVASLAADHRASDGHRGARFLVALNETLQYPEDL